MPKITEDEMKAVQNFWNAIAQAQVIPWVTKLDPNKKCCENCINFERKLDGKKTRN